MTQCSPEDIQKNTCKLDVNSILCLKGACDANGSYDPQTANQADFFIQDIFLASTMFIGTVVTFVLIISGIKYILAGGNMDNAAKAKEGIQHAIIGLVIVTFSYTIIRVIQYIVAGYK